MSASRQKRSFEKWIFCSAKRTMLVNALRGHLAEFGLVGAQGLHKVAAIVAIVRNGTDERIPEAARQVRTVIAGQIDEVEATVANSRAILTPPLKSSIAIISLQNIDICGVAFRAQL
jgi:transposase